MKKLISIILAISIVFGFAVPVSAMSGEGTELNPYMISTPAELMAISDNLSAHYKLANDIDMSDVYDYKPIGNAADGAFTGSLDGSGFTIKNLTIDLPGEKYTGLFGYNEGKIINLSLSNANITGGRYTGGIAGYSGTKGMIGSCSVSGAVSAKNALIECCAGGIAGSYSGPQMNNCVSNTNVSATGDETNNYISYAGGITGILKSNISNVSSSGKTSVINNFISNNNIYVSVYIGGVSGLFEGSAANCNSTSEVVNNFKRAYTSTSHTAFTGGLFGRTNGDTQVIGCDFSGKIYGNSYYTGGLIGSARGNSIKLESSNNFSNLNDGYYAGGMIAESMSSLYAENCNNYGSINGEYSGGIIGNISGNSTNNLISDCHNFGTNKSETCTGGIVAHISQGVTEIKNCSNRNTINSTYYCGGIVGVNDSTANKIYISNCHNEGDVFSSVSYCGGILGRSYATANLSCCFNLGTVSGDLQVGGIIGYGGTLSVNECYNSGAIISFGDGNNSYAGGIIGYGSSVTIKHCYNTGYSNGYHGSSGIISNSYKKPTVKNSYSAGNVVSKYGRASQIYPDSSISLENVYYLSTAYTYSNSLVYKHGTELSDSQMKEQSSFGWDFENIWHMDPNMNNGYPMLRCFAEEQYAMDISYSNLVVGDTITLTPYHNGVPVEAVSWISSDGSVAGVSSNGVVTANNAGSTTITATTAYGHKINSCISVVESSGGYNVNNTKINVGDHASVALLPKNNSSNDYIVKCESNDPSIASIDSPYGYPPVYSTGVSVKGVSMGECTITATSYLGEVISFNVTVTSKATSIKFSSTSTTVNRGKTKTLEPTVTPSPTQSTLTWSSSDESIATVDQNGVITGVSCGQAVITVQTDNGYSATCTVTVNVPAETLTMEQSSITVTKGYTDKVVAVPDPVDTTDTITYSTSSSTYVSVNSSTGVISGNKAGTATITATASSGAKAYCTVTVVEAETPVTGITLEPSVLNIHIGELYTLSPTVLPSGATNKQLVWSVSDSSIATVNQTGVVKGISNGTTVVTATTVDGGYSVSCTVNVVIDVSSISLNIHQSNLSIGSSVQLEATVLPENATDKTVKWISADETVASVDSTGLVTARKAGGVLITASVSGGEYTDTCYVKVSGLSANAGTNAVVDTQSSYIYGIDAGLDQIDDYVVILDSTCSLEYDTLTGDIGTGSLANLVRDGEIVDSYTVILFGDVNGDGWYDGEDAFLVNLITEGLLTKENIPDYMWTAADCNHDGLINEVDVDLLMGAGVKRNDIEQNVPQTELVTQTAYIEYASIIDQSAGMSTGIIPEPDTDDIVEDTTVPEISEDVEPNEGTTTENENSDVQPDEPVEKTDIEVIFANIFEFIKKILSFIFSFII